MRPSSKKKGNTLLNQQDRQSSKSACLPSNSKRPKSTIKCTRMPSSRAKRPSTTNYATSTRANPKKSSRKSKCPLSSKEIRAAESSPANLNPLMTNFPTVAWPKSSAISNTTSPAMYLSLYLDRMDQRPHQERTTQSRKTCKESRSTQKHLEKKSQNRS